MAFVTVEEASAATEAAPCAAATAAASAPLAAELLPEGPEAEDGLCQSGW